MRSKSLAVSALLVVVLALSAVMQAYSFAPAEDAQRAEQMVKVAEAALFKVESFVNSTLQDANVTGKLESLGLMDEFRGNASLLDQAKALMAEAKADMEAGNYTDAVEKAMEAMKVCRDVFKSVHEILEEAGLEEAEKPEIRAQGLLVAIDRALERIKRIEALLPKDASDVKALLSQAAALLNLTEAEQLLREGNVTEVAHRLAEANKLIAQAFKQLKSKAEEKAAERVEKFKEKVEERLREIAGKMNETELGEAMRKLGFGNVSSFNAFIEELARQAVEHAKSGKVGEAAGKLKGIGEKMKEFAKAYRAKEIPQVGESLSLNVSVEVSKEKLWTMVKVTVENAGNATIAFPNSAFGSIIEREVDGKWIPYYSPISIQVIVKLNPGEARSFSIKLFKPEAGQYRVVVHGFSAKTMTPVSASAEFTIAT
jgi:tetratricopeptide (TPR) repeat protein